MQTKYIFLNQLKNLSLRFLSLINKMKSLILLMINFKLIITSINVKFVLVLILSKMNHRRLQLNCGILCDSIELHQNDKIPTMLVPFWCDSIELILKQYDLQLELHHLVAIKLKQHTNQMLFLPSHNILSWVQPELDFTSSSMKFITYFHYY